MLLKFTLWEPNCGYPRKSYEFLSAEQQVLSDLFYRELMLPT